MAAIDIRALVITFLGTLAEVTAGPGVSDPSANRAVHHKYLLESG